MGDPMDLSGIKEWKANGPSTLNYCVTLSRRTHPQGKCAQSISTFALASGCDSRLILWTTGLIAARAAKAEAAGST